MAFWSLYYHLVWATKDRLPLITEEVERKLYGYITIKIEEMASIFYAIGGVEDHIHLVVSIPPKVAVSNFIAKIKGSSSHYVKAELNNSSFSGWQQGYSVFSFGKKDLERAISYVKNQKQHHKNGTTILKLEQFE
jgi:REP element-mobilizing transposase RayT